MLSLSGILSFRLGALRPPRTYQIAVPSTLSAPAFSVKAPPPPTNTRLSGTITCLAGAWAPPSEDDPRTGYGWPAWLIEPADPGVSNPAALMKTKTSIENRDMSPLVFFYS